MPELAYASYDETWLRSYGRGNAGEYIKHIDDLKPGTRVILVCRVSNRERKRNLPDQEAWLRRECQRRGLIVIGVLREKLSGFDPAWIARTAAIAKRCRAVLLAESTDRFVRSPFFHTAKTPYAQAQKSDLDYLAFFTEGATLVTVLPPDATPRDVRSHQRRRGQWAKNRKGGRRSTKRCEYRLRRTQDEYARLATRFARLQRRHRLSQRAAAAQLGLPESSMRSIVLRLQNTSARNA